MSEIKFLATTNEPLTKTSYKYLDILPNIKPDDMFGGGGISFVDQLSSAESTTIKNIFKGYNVYAIHTDLGLCCETRYKTVLSPKAAQNMFDELCWLKVFIKKQLKKNNMVFLICLNLGVDTDIFSLKTQYIDIDNWVLQEDKDTIFKYGIIYQFVDNSKNHNQ
jgi:hypothetical protein